MLYAALALLLVLALAYVIVAFGMAQTILRTIAELKKPNEPLTDLERACIQIILGLGGSVAELAKRVAVLFLLIWASIFLLVLTAFME